MNCPNKQKNSQMCTCTYSGCEKHGLCCECLHYHRKKGALPACFFTAEEEKTYDRSIAHFIRTHQK